MCARPRRRWLNRLGWTCRRWRVVWLRKAGPFLWKSWAAIKPGGRIQREDVEAAIAARRQLLPAYETEAQVVPHSRIRQITAQRMAESAHATAPVTLTTEADATELVALREQLKSSFGRRGLRVPSYNDIYIKLAAAALQEHPTLNSSWSDEGLVSSRRDSHRFCGGDGRRTACSGAEGTCLRKSLRAVAAETASLIEGAQQETLES